MALPFTRGRIRTRTTRAVSRLHRKVAELENKLETATKESRKWKQRCQRLKPVATPRKSPSASHSSTPIQRLFSPSSDSCSSQPNASSLSDLSNIDNGIEVISYQDWLNLSLIWNSQVIFQTAILLEINLATIHLYMSSWTILQKLKMH